MTALVVCDLHLGARSGVDLARRPAVREALLDALAEEGADELVLLGDALELREGRLDDAMDAAQPFFEALGPALGPEGRVLLVAGNHDHRLVAPWLQRRQAVDGEPLGLEQRLAPEQASGPAAQLARWAEPAALEVAYPGAWLRPDVYATHGHYLDRHVTIPGLEPLAVRAVERYVSARGGVPDGVEGYEAVVSPVYALAHEIAQAAPADEAAAGAGLSGRVYRLLISDGGPTSLRLARLAARVTFPAAVAVINISGLGPVVADVSAAQLRRAGLRAMIEVARRLEIDADHVVFGHTHRAGPLPDDDPAEWRHSGGLLHNAGCWVYDATLNATPEGPYWPGRVVVIGDEGPPRLRALLGPDLGASWSGRQTKTSL